jgi:hypothetical protein
MNSLPKSETHPIISLNPSESNITNEEGKYVFVGKVYGSPDINKDFLKVFEFLENFTVVNNIELLNENDNIYNWILYSDDNSDDIRFTAIHIISPYELGTTHHALVNNKKVNAQLIYGAGELKKKDNKIIFNLLSGTYTKKLTNFNFNESIKKEIINKFLEFLPDSIYDNTRDSYVNKIKTVSNKLLELYKNIGYIVRIFEISNDCVEFNNKFWHYDWSIEYYKKKLDNKENDYDIINMIYLKVLEEMSNLLKIN